MQLLNATHKPLKDGLPAKAGFYLMSGGHWIGGTAVPGFRCLTCVDPEHALRFNTEGLAQAIVLLEHPRSLTVVEVRA